MVVSPNGTARPFTGFPDHDKGESVPTSLPLGPDGHLGVGEAYVSACSIADRDGTVMEGKKAPCGQVWKILGF